MEMPLIHQALNTALLCILLLAQFLNREKGDGLGRRARRRAAYGRDAALFGRRKAQAEGHKPGSALEEAAERHAVAYFIALDMADNRKRDFSDSEIVLAVHAALAG